jgi:hypothetical protein
MAYKREPQNSFEVRSPRATPSAQKSTARRKTRDRFIRLNEFVDFSMTDLKRNQIAVWLALYRDERDGTTLTSQKGIAARAGCCTRTVRNAIKTLVNAGLVEVVYQGGLNRGPSRYRVQSRSND